jgi:hypothetical protein
MNALIKRLMSFIFLLLITYNVQAVDLDFSSWEKENKVLAVNVGMMAFITAWGVAKWDYFKESPNAQAEGWFGADTKEGGADKTGHFWSAYAFADGLSSVFRDWGYEPDEAAFTGALSSFAILGFMELGDSFSDFGFSHEDMIMNTVGAASSYVLYKYPSLDSKIDLRWEYTPDFKNADIFTDYENTKYLIALKLEGFETVHDTPLKYLEFHVGYFARGYADSSVEPKRNLYLGLGLNVGRALSDLGCGGICNIYEYYQPPYTYIATD